MRRSTAAIVAIILAFSSAARAEGTLGRRSSEAPFGWTGLYIGVNGGYGWGRVSNHLKVSSTAGSSSTASVTADVDGQFGGGQVGFNWKSQRWVYGVEADFQASGEDGVISGCSQSRCATIGYGLDWFGTLRGRLGYLLEPRFLLYATGGLAYGHVGTDFSASAAPSVAGSFNNSAQVASDSTTKAGWVVGSGLEMVLDRNWMLRAEYLYADLGTIASKRSTSVASACVTGPQCLDNLVETKTLRTDFAEQIFRIGLSYRFADVYTPLK